MPCVWSKPVALDVFKCDVCWDVQAVKNLVPQSTMGCNCGGLMCNACWLRDFDSRAKLYMVGDGGMSCWGQEEDELDLTLSTRPRCKKYVGRKCPFCNVTVAWKWENKPSVQATGRMLVNSPDLVVDGKAIL